VKLKLKSKVKVYPPMDTSQDFEFGDGATVPKPSAIVFDWDNTLVDTWPCIIHTMNATLKAMGHEPWSETEAKQKIAKSLRDSFPILFGDRWEDARDVFYAELETCHLDMLTLLPGAKDVIQLIAALKIPMAIVSNKTGRYLRAEIDKLGWTDYFQTIVGAGDLERDKPAPDAIFQFLERVKLAPGADIWFVGDSPVDVEIAYAAGCTAIFIRGEGHHTFALGCSPHIVIEDCRDLSALVKYTNTAEHQRNETHR